MNQGFVITRRRHVVATKLMGELAKGRRDVERDEHAKQQGKGDAESHSAAPRALAGIG